MTHHHEKPTLGIRCVPITGGNVQQKDGTVVEMKPIIDWPSCFSFDHYRRDEKELLDNRLWAKGYKKVGEWRTTEGDTWGPLSRACRYKTPEGEVVDVWYG